MSAEAQPMNRTSASAAPQRRAYWLKTLHQWHWISAALCLVGILLLSFTGLTLNHASQIEARPKITAKQGQLPPTLHKQLTGVSAKTTAPLPGTVQEWLTDNMGVRTGNRDAEWSEEEIYLSLPRPGGDAWVNIDLHSGAVEYELTNRGWISYLNDLHKGRHTGPVWGWFLDLLAIACLIFSISGLLLLKLHASQRPNTWPMVGFGLAIPILIALLFIH